MCETDYSGYPDCRDDTLKALQVALNLGLDSRFVIETPLMWIDKAQTKAMAEELGGNALIDLIRDKTHTCYDGKSPILFPPLGFRLRSLPSLRTTTDRLPGLRRREIKLLNNRRSLRMTLPLNLDRSPCRRLKPKAKLTRYVVTHLDKEYKFSLVKTHYLSRSFRKNAFQGACGADYPRSLTFH